eukprot:357894-Chlamydomonas_euryale.AAC.1
MPAPPGVAPLPELRNCLNCRPAPARVVGRFRACSSCRGAAPNGMLTPSSARPQGLQTRMHSASARL